MANTAPIAIPMEDELIHTDTRPLCNDPTCPCHQDLTSLTLADLYVARLDLDLWRIQVADKVELLDALDAEIKRREDNIF